MYYISTNNHLSTKALIDGDWRPGEDLSSYTAAPNTRHLSVVSTISLSTTKGLLENDTSNESLLLLENAAGNVAVLLKYVHPCTSNCEDPSWLDISKENHSVPVSEFSPLHFNYTDEFSPTDLVASSTLYESSPGTIFRPPFASGASIQVDNPGSHFQVHICHTALCNDLYYADYYSLTNTSHGCFIAGTYPIFLQQILQAEMHDTGQASLERPSSSPFAGIAGSDIAILDPFEFAIWINGTEPITFTFGEPRPYTAPYFPFPFTRLASAASLDRTESYLYHQIDETRFAEETFAAGSDT